MSAVSQTKHVRHVCCVTQLAHPKKVITPCWASANSQGINLWDVIVCVLAMLVTLAVGSLWCLGFHRVSTVSSVLLAILMLLNLCDPLLQLLALFAAQQLMPLVAQIRSFKCIDALAGQEHERNLLNCSGRVLMSYLFELRQTNQNGT